MPLDRNRNYGGLVGARETGALYFQDGHYYAPNGEYLYSDDEADDPPHRGDQRRSLEEYEEARKNGTLEKRKGRHLPGGIAGDPMQPQTHRGALSAHDLRKPEDIMQAPKGHRSSPHDVSRADRVGIQDEAKQPAVDSEGKDAYGKNMGKVTQPTDPKEREAQMGNPAGRAGKTDYMAPSGTVRARNPEDEDEQTVFQREGRSPANVRKNEGDPERRTFTEPGQKEPGMIDAEEEALKMEEQDKENRDELGAGQAGQAGRASSTADEDGEDGDEGSAEQDDEARREKLKELTPTQLATLVKEAGGRPKKGAGSKEKNIQYLLDNTEE